MEISWVEEGEEHHLIGGTIPGMPGVVIGKNDYLAWSMTAPLNDNSDLFKEKLSVDGKMYFVDGEWREVKQREL